MSEPAPPERLRRQKSGTIFRNLSARQRRLAQVLVKDPEPLLYHAEIVTRNGKNAGYVRSGSYCCTLGGAVGLFMIEAQEADDEPYVARGKWEINIAGQKYPAQVSLKPLYDPENKKIKC